MKTMNITDTVSFLEAQFASPEAADQTIKNVVLLGANSRDSTGKVRRKYTQECMAGSLGLYDGVQAYLNHPTPEERRTGSRDIKDLAGHFSQPRHDVTEQKIKADFIPLPNDPAGAKFIAIARSMPRGAGCSHNAVARASVKDGVQIVESMDRVVSVDLVDTPATTAGMFESIEHEPNGVTEMEIKDLTIASLREQRPDLVGLLVKEGVASRDTEVKTLTEAKDAADLKIDTYQVKESMAARRTLVLGVLEASEFPKAGVTELFTNTLLAVEGKDDAEITTNVNALIADRKLCIESTGGVINSTERNSDEGKPVVLKSVAQIASAIRKNS